MSRWIEVEPLMDKAKEYGGYYEETVYAVPLADISEAPSIDIVRCKECEWAEWNDRDNWYVCKCHIPHFNRTADFYCGYGERKESK